ncbi:MAG: HAMP domain-containing sensor histidine kinase [Deltaproteobacteria bacterium]|nr:HAMP domain-containing sensor histidine kinase [Deltaproteobacteria bacterium]
MTELYAYSLVPVLSVALLLFWSALFHTRDARGLTAYCLSVAVWSASLLMASFPPTAPYGQRLVATGGFVAAAYLHTAFDFTRQRSYALVWVAYAVAAAITLAHLVWPGFIYDPVGLTTGPAFWHSMVLAIVAATIPLWQLSRAYQDAKGEERRLIRGLYAAGLLSYLGAWTTAFLLSHGMVRPYGNLIVLASLFVMAHVVRGRQGAGARRLLERSLIYSTVAAFLSAGFLFGVLSLMSSALEPDLLEYRLAAFFILVMAAVAFEPLRQQIQEGLGRWLLRDKAGAPALAEQLVVEEARASQAVRLAEVGTFASAVAHEVRNPLGIISARLRLLERQGVDPDTLATLREQVVRAERFVGDLLRYGRPGTLEPRELELAALVDVAFTTARDGLGEEAPEVRLERRGLEPGMQVEADQAQLLGALVVLFENALLALRGSPGAARIEVECTLREDRVELKVSDNGPGVPLVIADRLFEPFVTGRKRDTVRSGTGLGLAIAREVARRHGGSLTLGPPEGEGEGLGGATFLLTLPRRQPLLAAAGARAS